jgi:hypothetical protein
VELQMLAILEGTEDCLSSVDELPHFAIDAVGDVDGDVFDVVAVEVAVGGEAFDESVDGGLSALQ